MKYDPKADTYTCHNGKRLKVSKIKKEKKQRQDMREKQRFTVAKTAADVPAKKNVSKETTAKSRSKTGRRTLYVSQKFNSVPEKEDLERITSEEGILLRVNEYPVRGKLW